MRDKLWFFGAYDGVRNSLTSNMEHRAGQGPGFGRSLIGGLGDTL